MTTIITAAAAAFVGGLISARFSRIGHNRQLRHAKTLGAEAAIVRCRDLALSEYRYWSDAGDKPGVDEVQQELSIGAMGASANILSALHGHPAEWHPKPQTESER